MSVTYGALIRRAAEEIAQGVGRMPGGRAGVGAAGEAAAYLAMVRALDLHLRQLLNPRAQPTGRTPPYPAGFESLASALCDQLHELGGSAASRADVTRSSHWHAAAVAIGAAGDLLATHAAPGGGARTPEAAEVLASAAARHAAIAELADVAAAALSVADVLKRGAAGDRGPDPVVAQVLAQECARRDRGSAGSAIDDLTLARPPIDTSHPLLELGDRLLHLRLWAWASARATRPTIDDLKVFAAVGQAVAAHAASVLGVGTGWEAWREVSAILRPWRTSVPASAGVVGHARRAMDLLSEVAPLAPGDGRASASRDVAEALRGASRITASIAAWNAETVSRLRETHPTGRADSLSGDAITDSPMLVAAKLARRPVEMPEVVCVQLREAYGDLVRSGPGAAMMHATGLPQAARRPGVLERSPRALP